MRTFDKSRSPGGSACIRLGRPENTAIKHLVITLYINAQQSSGITFPPARSGWLVSLDFLLAPFQIQMGSVQICFGAFEPEGSALLTLLTKEESAGGFCYWLSGPPSHKNVQMVKWCRRWGEIRLAQQRPVSPLRHCSFGRRRGNRCSICKYWCKLD